MWEVSCLRGEFTCSPFLNKTILHTIVNLPHRGEPQQVNILYKVYTGTPPLTMKRRYEQRTRKEGNVKKRMKEEKNTFGNGEGGGGCRYLDIFFEAIGLGRKKGLALPFQNPLKKLRFLRQK